MTEATGYPDLDHHLATPEPFEDADGYLIGWGEHLSPNAATWTPQEES